MFSIFSNIRIKYVFVTLFGSGVLAFGLYNVHSLSGVTEGGVLGLTLLLSHWCHISPAISGFVLSGMCYLFGWKILGKSFIAYSFISSIGFSVFYDIFEHIGYIWPDLANMPLLAAMIGAVFVGVGAGLCVRVGGAPSGDDALAMTLSYLVHIKIQWIYLLCDLIVLLLSLSYISLNRIIYSLLTVILSGQILGMVQKVNFRKNVYRENKTP